MEEQELNLRKYMINSVINDCKSNLTTIEQMLNNAKTEEDLKKIVEYLKYYINTLSSNVEKVEINKSK